MYDYLGDSQVKLFYLPIFIAEELDNDNNTTVKATTTHTGGLLRSFSEKDKLPLITEYYKYPRDFCVFDYRWGEEVFIIKGGKYHKAKSIDDIESSDIANVVLNNYGMKIEIKKVEDFKAIRDNFSSCIKSIDENRAMLFPEGITKETVVVPGFEEKYDKLFKKNRRIMDDFHSEWFIFDEYKQEKQLGEFLSVLIYLEKSKDQPPTRWSNPMEKYEDCKRATLEYIRENENIVEKYLKWLEVSERKRAEIVGVIEWLMIELDTNQIVLDIAKHIVD